MKAPGRDASLPGAFILKRPKRKQKVFLRLNSPSGARGILRMIVQVGRANSHPWLTALIAPSIARRPTCTNTLKTD